MNFAILDDWQKVVDSQANVLSVSSSCRSFSYAGRQLGWEADDGRHLALTIAFASLHGFQLMMFENVAPLLQDKQLRLQLEKILEWYGFRIIFEVCINIQTFHPVDRTRAIFIACHESLHPDMGKFAEVIQNLFNDIPTSLWQARRWTEIDKQLLRADASIPEDALNELSRFDRLPSFLKNRTFSKIPNEVLETRRLRSCRHIPSGTIMASYGKSAQPDTGGHHFRMYQT